MRCPTEEQRAGARSQKGGKFGLAPRALTFARLYAETPRCTISGGLRTGVPIDCGQ